MNNTAPAPPPGMSNPGTAQEYFNSMSGSWRDGERVTAGGTGYNTGSTNYTNYVFPDNPNNSTGWSMQNSIAAPHDYRLIGSSYFGQWQPMEAKELTLAIGTHIDRTASGNNLTSVNTMYADLPLLHTFYNNGYQLPAVVVDTFTCRGNCVYPGDANIDGVVNNWDYLYPATSYGVSGAPRTNQLNLFVPTQANDWTTSLANNLNTKYLDCDGNGVINGQDMNVITNNYGSKRTCTTAQPPNLPNVQFYMVDYLGNRIDTADFFNTSAIKRSLTLRCDIPNNDFYGIAFTVELDDSVFTGSTIASLKTPKLNYGTYKSLVKSYQSSYGLGYYKWEVVMTPTDGINTGSNGNLMKLYFDVNTSNYAYGTQPAHIRFKNVRIIKNDGTILSNYGMQNQTVHLRRGFVATDEQRSTLQKSSVYPNPASDNLTIDLGDATEANLRLYDIAGKLITQKNITISQSTLDVSPLSAGIYLIELSNEFGKMTHRFVK